MKETPRNLLVGLFVLIALVALGWLVFKFGDLPKWLARQDASEVTTYFTHAPGIQVNTAVYFRGYPAGRVIEVHPPAAMDDPCSPTGRSIQLAVRMALSRDYAIPANVTPTVYQRGLGSSYIELVLHDIPVAESVADGAVMPGRVSEGTEFIPEATKQQMDELLQSLMQMSQRMAEQLEPTSPEEVAAGAAPNITTVVSRMDDALAVLSQEYLGDPCNQRNFHDGLADFAALAQEMRQVVHETQDIAEEAVALISQISEATRTVHDVAGEASESVEAVSVKLQTAADEIAAAFQQLNTMLATMREGEGTVGRVINDPRLYEALTDAAENLNLTIADLRALIQQWDNEGVKLQL